MKELMIQSFVFLCMPLSQVHVASCIICYLLCVCYSFISSILSLGDKDIFFQQYGRYNINKIWRDDIFPCRVYLRHWSVLSSTY
uniref:Putative ovule protein n=1 Tax=Solanum chacoense TaxID=4108 RepID=A0A0V0HA62_SOLCH